MDTQIISTPTPVKVTVRVPSGHLRITATETAETTVTIVGEPEPNAVVVEYDAASATLSIRQRRAGRFWRGPLGGLRITLTVPTGSPVRVDSGSMDVDATGCIGSLTCNVASGDITAQCVDGALQCHCASGDVAATRVTGGSVVRTASGDVAIESAEGDVNVATVSGDIDIDAVHRGIVTVQSVSGDITTGVVAGVRLRLDLSAVSGQTRSELPVSDLPNTAASGSATEVDLRASSVSGDITVRRSRTQQPAVGG
ncbi:MAG: DUF4097 family beta strand repeat-containing protein [Actinomycetes bacterium]